MKALSAVGLLLAVATFALGAEELPVVFQEDFEKDGALEKWEPMDPSAWKIATQDGNKVLSMFKGSRYKTKVRSPRNFALIKDLWLGDFVLDLKMQSTTRDYGHRDLCLFFGHQDPTHFYYVHMALRADPHAHSVFIVNGKPRVSLIPLPGKEEDKEVFRTKGIVWGDGWHHVRLVRRVSDGLIEVYYDDMARPIMRAKDKTFTWGRVGVGSFDDTGNYDEIVIRGVKVEPPKK